MMMSSANNTLTAVPGIKLGHASDFEGGTGATALVFEDGVVGGIDPRGTATGSREWPALDPSHVTDKIHGLCLAGGSAFGLAAADGVMRYLEEHDIGYLKPVAVIPIVPAAILYDLNILDPKARPDAEMGYQACLNASDGPVVTGTVGAGTGATVGKLMGINQATKSGVGSSCLATQDGILVGALAVVNNLGDVLDHRNGRILAGCRDSKTGRFVDVAGTITGQAIQSREQVFQNTNLCVVATNAALSKVECTKMAQMASAGMARTLSPCFSTYDGDVIFALSTGDKQTEINRVGVMAAEALALAINDALMQATSLGGVPALADLPGAL